jgi:hypothetical protein
MAGRESVVLTDKLVRSAELGSTTSDALVPGFQLRVSPKGKRVFCVRYRWNGSRRRDTLGKYLPGHFGLADARGAAQAILVRVKAGQDPRAVDLPPVEPDKPESELFRDLAPPLLESYMEKKQRRPATRVEYRRIVEQRAKEAAEAKEKAERDKAAK